MYQEFKNKIDFFIRNSTKFSRRNFVETDIELIKRNRAENNYTFDLLNRHFSKTTKPEIKILDIGCKNWFYAEGMHRYFSTFCNNLQLDGVELDAFRLYSNLYSRFEVAKYYTKELKNCNYITGNLLEVSGKYDYITWFLPFVHISPHISWGLPKNLYYPEKLLEHAYKILEQNGQMLIINQGEIEYEIQKSLLEKLNIPYKELGQITSKEFNYKKTRYGFLCNKTN